MSEVRPLVQGLSGGLSGKTQVPAVESLFAETWFGQPDARLPGKWLGWRRSGCCLGRMVLVSKAKSSSRWDRPPALLQPPKTPGGRDTWGQL